MAAPLESIGFYTLSDERARNASATSRLMRCELVLTDACNFRCAYCRGLPSGCEGNMPFGRSEFVVREWGRGGLKSIRFSGGEPTLYRGLEKLVGIAKAVGVENIAVSTNGSSPWLVYERLLDAGVNDFSVSLDACCAAEGDRMAGGIGGAFDKVVANIQRLANACYTTVGVVLTDSNREHVAGIVALAEELGVNDIRVIPSAQTAKALDVGIENRRSLPILGYRMANVATGKPVRGLCASDSGKCSLALDDMAVCGDSHYPCIIYMRERGKPIGKIGPLEQMRAERAAWVDGHGSHVDPICAGNCLDVCVAYNNRCREFSGR
jgi:pyruvate-formate lyase-activating enzyme